MLNGEVTFSVVYFLGGRPADLRDDGVAALVHVAALRYFAEEFPRNPNVLIDGGNLKNAGTAIDVGTGSAVVAETTIVNSGQTLDRIYWIRTIFENARIRYNGGPLFLAGVTFKNCRFDFAPSVSVEVRTALTGRGAPKAQKPVTLLVAGNFSSLRLPGEAAR
jgi:hypothetical protein